MGIDGLLGSPLLFAGRASAALLLWVPALSPRAHAWKITLFAARGLLMSKQHCLVFVLGFQSWRVKETNRSFDRSRSKFADPRYRPRGRITKSVTVTTAYNRTILSGTAASAQYKMAKAALHLKIRKTRLKYAKLTSSSTQMGEKGLATLRKRERARAGIEPTAAAPCQPDCPDVSHSDHSAGSKESASWRALVV